MMRDIVGTIASVLEENPSGKFWNSITKTFDLMEIAEDEIDKAKHRHPDKADILHVAFGIARPTDYLLEMGEHVYRMHVRELLERVARGNDVGIATDAELMAILSGASFGAALNRTGTGMYLRLFRRLFPDFVFDTDAGVDDMLDDKYYEDWDGQLDEIASRERKKLYAKWRKEEWQNRLINQEER